MDRKKELLKLAKSNKELAINLADEIIFIEEQISEIKKLPFIKFNPENPSMQKATPAAKLYKELMQQYNNSIKTFSKLVGCDENAEDSPLRKWVKKRINQDVNNRKQNMDP